MSSAPPKVEKSGKDTYLGISVDRWVSLVQQTGMPIVLNLFVLVFVWVYVPAWMDRQLGAMEKTANSLTELSQGLNKTLDDHRRQCEQLERIERIGKQ